MMTYEGPQKVYRVASEVKAKQIHLEAINRAKTIATWQLGKRILVNIIYMDVKKNTIVLKEHNHV